MGVMEAKAKWELAKASSIWLHAGGAVGLVLSVEFGRVEVFGFLNLRLVGGGGGGGGREGLVPVSWAYWDLNLVMYGCQFSVRSRLCVRLGAKFSPLVRREVSESVRSRCVRLGM